MAEFISQNISLLISKTPESSFNTLKTAGSDFFRAVMRGNSFGLPVLDKIDNSDLVGTGYEFPTVLRVNYWGHNVMSIGEDANVDLMPLFLARAMGGTNAAPSTVDVTGKQHILLLQDTSTRQLPSSNLITSVGYIDDSNPGADFLWGGVVSENFQLSQSGGGVPTWSTELVSSGKYTTPLPTGVRTGLPTLVGVDTTNNKDMYVHPAAIVISYTDGSSVNLATAGRIKSWNFQLNNNLRRDDRRPGDPFRTANDPTTGAYVNRLLRGKRQCSAQVVVSLDENLDEFSAMAANRVIDNLAIILKGNLIAGGVVGTNYAVEINIPKCYMRTVSPGNENDDVTLTLDFFPIKGTGEYMSATVTNTRATAYA